MIVGRLLDGKMLSHTFFKSFFDNHTFDNILDEIYEGKENAKNDMAQLILAHLEELHGMQRLFILIAWDICSNIVNKSSFIGNVFCIDNLDNVESDRIKTFLKYYTQFWLNMINALYDFKLTKWGINAADLVQNYAFIIVLRETTYSKLTEHLNGREKGMVEEFNIDQIYSECNVFENRSKFLQDNKDLIPQSLFNESMLVDSIIGDKYIRKNVLSIYNYDNNTAIKTLCTILNKSNNAFILQKYDIIKKINEKDRRGVLGIVLYLLLKHFRDKMYFDDNLMLYSFKRLSENQYYKYSATRLLLSYLNNSKEPVSMYQIFSYFENVISPEHIASIFYNIYQLRFSDWRHLITFTDYPPSDSKWVGIQTNLYENAQNQNDEKFAKVQITEAGKNYLKMVVPHFEFFSVRIENELPLFCSRVFETDYSIRNYISVIDRVFNSVKDCNIRIRDTVIETCSIKNWTNEDYLKSKFMYTNPSSGKKQFHGERVIFSHIGYINAFRKYVISCEDVSVDKRAEHNKKIAELIKKYLTLYDSPDCLKSGRNNYAKSILWKQTIKVIENNKDFSLPIEVDSDDL